MPPPSITSPSSSTSTSPPPSTSPGSSRRVQSAAKAQEPPGAPLVRTHGTAGLPSAVRRPSATLPKPLDADRQFITHHGQRIALYLRAPHSKPSRSGLHPLVLLHSINAASSAAEVRPIFDHYSRSRPVLAIELPGFGSADRNRIEYTPQLMRDSVVKALELLLEFGFHRRVDLMAVSLSCEIAARVALEHPTACRSLAFISPTGFESRRAERYRNGQTKDRPWLRALLESGPWSKPLFRMLTSEKSMRQLLERTWGSKQIDEGLLAYNLKTVVQDGARHAPYALIGGGLFTRGVAQLYAQLNQPVWMIHGRRGEFAVVDGLEDFLPAGRWTIESVDTGAMPYFEQPAEFAQRYDAFVQKLQPA